MIRILILLISLLIPSVALAEWRVVPISHTHEGVQFQSQLIYDPAVATPRPALVMVPSWMGPNPDSIEKAKRVARDRYVVLLADVYGVDVRPSNASEAGAAAGALRNDPPRLRVRTQAALDQLIDLRDGPAIAPGQVAVIGFCFGGTAALELARSGADIPAVVAFHAGLATQLPAGKDSIKARILVLNGADDPAVPPEQVREFEVEMQAANADWQLVNFGGAVHSFTNPKANVPGRNEYHPVVADRAFVMMDGFLAGVFGR